MNDKLTTTSPTPEAEELSVDATRRGSTEYARRKSAGSTWTRMSVAERNIAKRAGGGVAAEGIRVALRYWNSQHPAPTTDAANKA